MSENFQYYQYNVEQFNQDKNEIYKFLHIVKDFTEYTYEEKVSAMQKLWGDIKDTKTVYYGDKCKVKITYGKDKKYHFNFDMDSIPLDYLKEVIPEIGNDIQSKVNTKVKELMEEENSKKQTTSKKNNKKQNDLNDFYNNISEISKNQL